MPTNRKITGTLYAILSSSAFGFIPLFSIPLLASGMHTPSILAYRFALAAVVMGVLALLRKESFRITGGEIPILFGLSLLYGATSMGLLLSYQYIPSGVATTIHFLYPITVALVMGIWFRERLSPLVFIAAPVSIAGVGLLSWSHSGGLRLLGVGLVLVTVLCYGLYIVAVSKTRISRLSSAVLTFYVMLAASLVFGTYALLSTGIEPVPSVGAWGNIAMLVLIPTIVSNLCLVLAVKYAGSTVAALMGCMEPVTAVIVGFLVFNEHIGLSQLAGLILVLVAVSMIVLQQKKEVA